MFRAKNHPPPLLFLRVPLLLLSGAFSIARAETLEGENLAPNPSFEIADAQLKPLDEAQVETACAWSRSIYERLGATPRLALVRCEEPAVCGELALPLSEGRESRHQKE